MEIREPYADELGDAQAGRVQQLDHRAIAQAERRGRVGLIEQPIHFIEREKLGQRRPRARRAQVVGGARADPSIEHEEAIEAADGGDAARNRSRREAAGSLLAHERLERRAIERVERAACGGGIPSERGQIARVALERVIGQPALDAQMIQESVDHRTVDSRLSTRDYDSIRRSFLRS